MPDETDEFGITIPSGSRGGEENPDAAPPSPAGESNAEPGTRLHPDTPYNDDLKALWQMADSAWNSFVQAQKDYNQAPVPSISTMDYDEYTAAEERRKALKAKVDRAWSAYKTVASTYNSAVRTVSTRAPKANPNQQTANNAATTATSAANNIRTTETSRANNREDNETRRAIADLQAYIKQLDQAIRAGHYDATEAVSRFNAALDYAKNAQKFLSPYQPGFEPGGPASFFAQYAGLPFNAENYRQDPNIFQQALSTLWSETEKNRAFNQRVAAEDAARDAIGIPPPAQINAANGYGAVGTSGYTLPEVNLPDSQYVEIARQMAQKHGIDPEIFVRQINQESGFAEDVITGKRKSSAGATGIAQIMPQYHPGVDPLDPVASLDYAAGLMRSYLDKYGDYATALAAYNAGEGNVAKYGGIPPFAETQQYIDAILGPGRNRPVAATTTTTDTTTTTQPAPAPAFQGAVAPSQAPAPPPAPGLTYDPSNDFPAEAVPIPPASTSTPLEPETVGHSYGAPVLPNRNWQLALMGW